MLLHAAHSTVKENDHHERKRNDYCQGYNMNMKLKYLKTLTKAPIICYANARTNTLQVALVND
jgi:hypothetical protein